LNAGEQIEMLYRSEFGGGFPYHDCYLLADSMGLPREDLIPELDLYFSQIAGYVSSASRLGSRSPAEIEKALQVLGKDFFQVFPHLQFLQDRINEEETPDLFRRMRAVEEMRSRLLHLLAGFIANGKTPGSAGATVDV
jgi:hypothetical protein